MNGKLSVTLAGIPILLAGLPQAADRAPDFSALPGRPYLGQEPPGMTPELFAPGFISTGDHDGLYGCLDDGQRCVFDRASAGAADPVYLDYVTELRDGRWTIPQPVTFREQPSFDGLSLIPDPSTLLFASRRSADGRGESTRGHNIWMVKLEQEGFSRPRMFGAPINSDQNDIYPSFSKTGTIYFFSNRGGDFTNEDIYRARLTAGEYSEVESLGSVINTTEDEIDPFIAPDESYLIYCSKTLEGLGGYDLYVTFRDGSGSWTAPVNMGAGINSPGYDWIPRVTPDERYFFFNSDRSGNADVYWVDARVIETLRPPGLR
jgi:hypothetical protein